MSTGCEFFADAIIERAAGRLEGERARRLDRHLAGCPACAAALDVVGRVRAAPAPIPHGLEDRLRAAVGAAAPVGAPGRSAAGTDGTAGPGGAGRSRRRSAGAWRPWAVPLAVAAAAALVWLGVETGGAGPAEDADGVNEASTLLDADPPYGAWPAGDGVVAGEPLLSELSVEDLERLLEDMGS